MTLVYAPMRRTTSLKALDESEETIGFGAYEFRVPGLRTEYVMDSKRVDILYREKAFEGKSMWSGSVCSGPFLRKESFEELMLSLRAWLEEDIKQRQEALALFDRRGT